MPNQGEFRTGGVTYVSALPSPNTGLRGLVFYLTQVDGANSPGHYVVSEDGVEFNRLGGGNIKNNFAATTDPTTTDDSASGYEVGSEWINVSSGDSFICVDASAAAAVWNLSLKPSAITSNRTVQEYNSASGNLTLAVTVKTLAITMVGTDDVVVTLNPKAQYPDTIKIKRLGTGSGSITITPDGTEDIDGATGSYDASSSLANGGDLLELEPYSSGYLLG